LLGWQADLYRAAEAAAGSAEAFGPGEIIAVEGSAMDRLLIVREGSCCMIEVRAVSHVALRLRAMGAQNAVRSLLMCKQPTFSRGCMTATRSIGRSALP